MIDLSLVVCTYNRASMLDDLLSSFHSNLEFSGLNFELLVIDNHSSDNTRDIALKWENVPEMKLHYIFEPQQGSSNSRNRGISVAGGEWIWFVDDDIYFDANWLAGIANAIQLFPEASAIAGRILLDFENEAPAWLPDMAMNYYGLTRFGESSRLLGENEYPVSANAGFRRKIFGDIGNFRTDLGRKYGSLISWEETELTMRIKQSGGRIAYSHEALVHHRITRDRLTRRWLYRRVFADGISECRVRYPAHNFGILFCIKTASSRIMLVLKRILKLKVSITDQLWMMKRLGIAYQCLVKVFSLKSYKKGNFLNT